MTIQVGKESIQALLQPFSIEVTPRSLGALGDLRAHLPGQTHVYVTFLPGGDFADTLAACDALQAQGMVPVPHIALRNFSVALTVREGLQRLQDRGVTDILLVAGGNARATGSPDNVPALLEEGWFSALPWRSIGFAAHPEGHPNLDAAGLRAAEKVKYAYAQAHASDCYFLTQFCFTPEPLLAWMAEIQACGHALPVHAGIPGLASRKSLIRHARHCGIGASAQYLRRNLMNWKHFFRPQQPDNLLYALAQLADSPLRRLHFYPLGAFENTLVWINHILAGDFVLKSQGFTIGKRG